MRNYVGMLTITGLMTVSGAAYAGEASGSISELDREANALTLATGETFTLPEDYMIQDLQVGNKVTILYEEQDGEMVAEQVYDDVE